MWSKWLGWQSSTLTVSPCGRGSFDGCDGGFGSYNATVLAYLANKWRKVIVISVRWSALLGNVQTKKRKSARAGNCIALLNEADYTAAIIGMRCKVYVRVWEVDTVINGLNKKNGGCG